MRVLFALALLGAVACAATPTEAQQYRPILPMYEIHFENHNGSWVQIKTFEHNGTHCYISTEKVSGNSGLAGGISCVRK